MASHNKKRNNKVRYSKEVRDINELFKEERIPFPLTIYYKLNRN